MHRRANAAFSAVRYVFVDRDGVINRKLPEGRFVREWSDFELLPGAESAIAALNSSGRKVVVISNQRGIALGLYTKKDVEELHRRLQQHLASHNAHIDAFYYCPHDRDECDCRKPKTGLFEQAFRDFPQASAENSAVIGDSLSDIEAARALHAPSILVLGDPETRKPGIEKASALADARADSLREAVEKYLA
jgi:D-glycero-D-manno-heptose 1,7-bisphosphate phosphatase